MDTVDEQVDGIVYEIISERANQDALWGEQNHPNGPIGTRLYRDHVELAKRRCRTGAAVGLANWRDILDEEVAEAYASQTDAELRAELIQVAAVAAAWVAAIDRRPATNVVRLQRRPGAPIVDEIVATYPGEPCKYCRVKPCQICEGKACGGCPDCSPLVPEC